MDNQGNSKASLVAAILYMGIGGASFQFILMLWRATPNKVYAIAQILLVVLAAIILSMAVNIVKELSDGFTTRIGQKLYHKLLSLLDRHEQKYLQFIEAEFKFLELRGIGKTEIDRYLYITIPSPKMI